MDEVFDLREFIMYIVRKFKLVIVVALVCAVLGAAFGFFSAGKEKFTTTSSAGVNVITKTDSDATALTSIMTNIKDTVAGDYFYTGVLNSIQKNVDSQEFNRIFEGNKRPAIADLKKVIKIYVNGNLVLIDVTVTDEALSVEASNAGRTYIMEELSKNINNISVVERGFQTISASLQTGEIPKTKAIKFGVLGFGSGIILTVFYIFFVDVMSLKVKSIADLKKYKLPVFGEVKADGGKSK